MFLAVIALILLASFLAFWQYSTPLGNGNVATPADTYAQNMLIWHQAAMLQVAQNNKYPAYQCVGACAIDLNMFIYDDAARAPRTAIVAPSTTVPALAANWPTYQPLFIQGDDTGWHSFLLRNTDLATGTATTQSWVLTYYLQPPNVTGTSLVNGSAGVLSPDKLVNALVKTNGERTGVGLLQCTTNAAAGSCGQVQFVPRAAELNNRPTDPTAVMIADQPITIPITLTPAAGNLHTMHAPDSANSAHLRGAAALLTRVQNSGE